jgi:hypothetical protein
LLNNLVRSASVNSNRLFGWRVMGAEQSRSAPAAAWMGSSGSGAASGRIFPQYAGSLRPSEFEKQSRSAPLRFSSRVSLPSLPLLCLSIPHGSSSSWPCTREGGGARGRRPGGACGRRPVELAPAAGWSSWADTSHARGRSELAARGRRRRRLDRGRGDEDFFENDVGTRMNRVCMTYGTHWNLNLRHVGPTNEVKTAIHSISHSPNQTKNMVRAIPSQHLQPNMRRVRAVPKTRVGFASLSSFSNQTHGKGGEKDNKDSKYSQPRWCPSGLTHTHKRRLQ